MFCYQTLINFFGQQLLLMLSYYKNKIKTNFFLFCQKYRRKWECAFGAARWAVMTRLPACPKYDAVSIQVTFFWPFFLFFWSVRRRSSISVPVSGGGARCWRAVRNFSHPSITSLFYHPKCKSVFHFASIFNYAHCIV